MIKLDQYEYATALKSVFVSNAGVVDVGKPADIYKDFMLITASCGRGKTTFALSIGNDGLLAQINRERQKQSLFEAVADISPEQVLFLTSRKSIKQQQLRNEAVVQATADDYKTKKVLDFTGNRNNKIRLTTAHQFGYWIRNNEIEVAPQVIIIDEIHSIFAETIFCEDLRIVLEYIAEHSPQIVKVGLTATPQFLLEYIADDRFTFAIIDKDLGSKYKVKEISVQIRGSAETLLKQIKPQISQKHKVIYYTQSATECHRLATEYGSRGAFLISDYNESMSPDGLLLADIMREAGVKDYILENEALPADIDIIFINSACREGINIKDNAVKTIICEAVDLITIEQILGRIRKDLDRFMVVSNFQNAERNKSNIEKAVEFMRALEDAETATAKQIVMAERYGKQSENRNLQKLVYSYDGTFRLNTYAKAYLEYINEAYIQISNYKSQNSGYYVSQVGNRNLLLNTDYFGQLSKYAENGVVDIAMVWETAITKSKENAVEAFRAVENEWLDKPLSKADKDRLCAELAVVNSRRQIAGWNTIKTLIAGAGYKVEDKRTSKARYTIITKQ